MSVEKHPLPSTTIERRPMARATRVSLFQREIRERLSQAALDILFAGAKVLSEGQVGQTPGGSRYFGSTMLTLDLGRAKAHIRDPMDAATALRLVEMMRTDDRVSHRLSAIARNEAERMSQKRLVSLEMEVTFEPHGARVEVDLDVEALIKDEGRKQLKLGFRKGSSRNDPKT